MSAHRCCYHWSDFSLKLASDSHTSLSLPFWFFFSFSTLSHMYFQCIFSRLFKHMLPTQWYQCRWDARSYANILLFHRLVFSLFYVFVFFFYFLVCCRLLHCMDFICALARAHFWTWNNEETICEMSLYHGTTGKIFLWLVGDDNAFLFLLCWIFFFYSLAMYLKFIAWIHISKRLPLINV